MPRITPDCCSRIIGSACFTAITMPRRFRSEEHTSELQSQPNLVCRLLLEKKKKTLTKALSATLSSSSLYHHSGVFSTRLHLLPLSRLHADLPPTAPRPGLVSPPLPRRPTR